MQVNPMCEEFRGGYKEATFSGTSDAYGLLVLTSLPRVIIGVIFDQGGIGVPFFNEYGLCYIRATAYDGSVLSNYALSGKYFYLENKMN